jgi:hypothetical protein
MKNRTKMALFRLDREKRENPYHPCGRRGFIFPEG